jgi:hypothetical protein
MNPANLTSDAHILSELATRLVRSPHGDIGRLVESGLGR